ncbi:MAG: glycoside hydrolase family 19 protein [Hydrogenophaga sp.]|nr:glycoside hydrolase family 19 protein [Hydrogenophaga sp.]
MANPDIPHLNSEQQRQRAEALLVTAYRNGITEPRELANFMGQVQHESQNFTRLEENLNYSGSRLYDVFPKRNGLTREGAQSIANIQDKTERRHAVAEQVYGGEWGKARLGNTEAGDAFTFRGRGYMQLTGRSNYTDSGQKLGLDLVRHPELAANQQNAERIAVQYWKDNIQPVRSARTDATQAGSIINTGGIGGEVKGLPERLANAAAWESTLDQAYLEAALKRHPQTQVTAAADPLNQPLQLKPTHQLSPQSLQLIQQSEQQVRAIADRHQLPWNPGLDNTVHAVAQQAREQGMTGITHLKVQDGQIRFAQHDGYSLREGQLDARAAANTETRESIALMARADQGPAHASEFSHTPTRATESAAMTL